jgi:hypothetical protein
MPSLKIWLTWLTRPEDAPLLLLLGAVLCSAVAATVLANVRRA